MKKIFAIILSVVLVFSTMWVGLITTTTASEANLLIDAKVGSGITTTGGRIFASSNVSEIIGKNGSYGFLSTSALYQGFTVPFAVEAGKTYTLSFSVKSDCDLETLAVLDTENMGNNYFNSDGKLAYGYETNIDKSHFVKYTAGKVSEAGDTAEWFDFTKTFTVTKSSDTYALFVGIGGGSGELMFSNLSLIIDQPTTLSEYTIADWTLPSDKSVEANTQTATSKNGGYAVQLNGFTYRGLYTTFTVEKGEKYTLSFSTKTNLEYEYIAITDRDDLSFNDEGKCGGQFSPGNSTVALTPINQKKGSGEWVDVSYSFTPTTSSIYYLALSFASIASGTDGSVIISDLALTKSSPRDSLNDYTVNDWTFADDRQNSYEAPVTSKNGGYAFTAKTVGWRGIWTTFDVNSANIGVTHTITMSIKNTAQIFTFCVTDRTDLTLATEPNGNKTGGFNEIGATEAVIDVAPLNENLDGETWKDISYTFNPTEAKTYYICFYFTSQGDCTISDLSLSRAVEVKSTGNGAASAILQGNKITYKAHAYQDDAFLGWFEGDTLVSTEPIYTPAITVDNDTVLLEGRFSNVNHAGTMFDATNWNGRTGISWNEAKGEYEAIGGWAQINALGAESRYGGNSVALSSIGSQGTSVPLALEPNTKYDLSFEYKSCVGIADIYLLTDNSGSLGVGDGKPDASALATALSIEKSYTKELDPHINSAPWNHVDISFITGEETTYYLFFIFAGESGTENKLYFSDFSLTKIGIYTLAVSSDYNLGYVSPSERMEVDDGQKVTLVATPLSDNIFTGWYDDEDQLVSQEAVYTYYINAANVKTYEARFKKGSLAIDNAGFENAVSDTKLVYMDKNSDPVSSDPKLTIITTDKGSDWQYISLAGDDAHSGKQSLYLNSADSFSGYRFKGLEENTTYTVSFWAKHTAGSTISGYVGPTNVSPILYREDMGEWTREILVDNLGMTKNVESDGNWHKVSVNFNTADNTDVTLWWYLTFSAYIDDISIIKTHKVEVVGKGGTASVSESGYVRENTEITFSAIPNEGNTFKGWYTEDDTLYTTESVFTRKLTEPFKLYAIFEGYNYPTRELLAVNGQDGTFENGTVYEWRAVDPDTITSTNRWCTWTISSKYAYEGKKSLRVHSRIRNSILPLEGLSKNTAYQLSFYLYQPDTTGRAFVQHAAVIDAESDDLGLAKKVFARTSGLVDDQNEWSAMLGTMDGNSGWHKINLYFETAEETSVNFLLRFWAPDNAGESQYVYLDNFFLNEYVAYDKLENADFSDGEKYWIGQGQVEDDAWKLNQTDDAVRQLVSIGTDKRATIRFRAKGEIYAAASDVSAGKPSITNAISSKSYVETEGDWKEYEFEVYTAAHKAIALTFMSKNGEAYIDDVAIEIAASSTGGVLEYIDFESERFEIKNSDPYRWSIYEASGSDDANVHSGNKALRYTWDPNAVVAENLMENYTINNWTLANDKTVSINTSAATSRLDGYAVQLNGFQYRGLYASIPVEAGVEYKLSFSTKGNVSWEYIAVTDRTDLVFSSEGICGGQFSSLNSTVDVAKINNNRHNSSDISDAAWTDVSYTFTANKTGTYTLAIAFAAVASDAEAKTVISDFNLIKTADVPVEQTFFNEAYMSYNSVLGVSYRLSLYYKIVNGSKGGSITITPEKSGTICPEVGMIHKATNDGWNKLEFLFNNTGFTNLRTYIANIVSSTNGDFYIDDIKLEIIDPLIVQESIKASYAELLYNAIENGAFEEPISNDNWANLPSSATLIESDTALSGTHYLRVTEGTKYILPIKVNKNTLYNFGVSLRSDAYTNGFVGLASVVEPEPVYYTNTDLEVASKIYATATNGEWKRNGFQIMSNSSGYVYLVVECTSGSMDIDSIMLFDANYANEEEVNDYSITVPYDFDAVDNKYCKINGGYGNQPYYDGTLGNVGNPSTGDSGIMPIYLLLLAGGALFTMLLLSKKNWINFFTKSVATKSLCLLLCATLAVSLLGGCNPKNGEGESSSNNISSEETTSEETTDVEQEPEEIPEEEEIIEENTENNFEYNDEGKLDVVNYEVYNNSTPINTNYRGVSSTVYHAFGFMKDDRTGRVYSDKMMNLELDRLQNFGIKATRTRYDSEWVWETKTNSWNWQKTRFQYFLDYAEEMQKRKIDVGVALGWEFRAIADPKADYGNLDEIDYLRGIGEDVYGETLGYDFTGKSADDIRLIKSGARFGYWIAETMRQAKSQRGINNIEYLYYFTEPSYATEEKSEGEEADEYITVCRAIRNKLIEEGVDSWAKHVGPNQGLTGDCEGTLLNYVLERDPDLFNIWTTHNYPSAESIINNVYYDLMEPILYTNSEYIKSANRWENGNEFWWDEFGTRANGLEQRDGNGWLGLQQVVCYISALYAGVDNINMWQLFDQLFTDNPEGYTVGEFEKGIHMCGHVPSLFNSSIPREQYYVDGLFSRYNGYQNGTVFATNNDDMRFACDLYISAVKLESGDYTITVVNTGTRDVEFHVNFEKAINMNLYRHVENANEVKPTSKGELALPDTTYVNVKDKFTDTLRGGDVAVYTSLRY